MTKILRQTSDNRHNQNKKAWLTVTDRHTKPNPIPQDFFYKKKS